MGFEKGIRAGIGALTKIVGFFAVAIRTPALLFRRGFLPRGGLGEDPLGLVFEQVAATGATDPVGFALVADLDRAAALGNDAERVRHVAGEGDPLARVADLAEPREGVTLGILGLQKNEHAVVVQRVYRDPAHSAGRGLGVGGQDQAFPVPNRLSGKRAGRAVGEGRVEDERSGAFPGRRTPALRYLPVLTVISSPAESLVSFQAQSADSLQNPGPVPA